MVILWCLLVAQLFIVGESNQLLRIVNGEQAKEGQFPYLVGLVVDRRIISESCGGSIISDEWILTAAHCFRMFPKTVTIYYGSTENRKGEVQIVNRRNIHRHPKYRMIFKNNYRHDIALIKTDKVKFTENIQSIPLPSPLTGKRWTNPGQSVIAAGWGAKAIGGSSADRLNWVEMELIDKSVCDQTYRDNLPRILCVGTHKKESVCSGDSGGPLVPVDENKLIGITSFGSALACDQGLPVVFTNVIDYLDWIESVSGVKP